ncbi:hypothetical protein SXCC_00436 [Gluconacetobacter sp. SXCC-1]|nr:hypothetical protein SXCC_00436 [Gluconacetobacter sp. SXCC-1]
MCVLHRYFPKLMTRERNTNKFSAYRFRAMNWPERPLHAPVSQKT